MKVRCNHADECKKVHPLRDCGATKVHDDSQCEPCPFEFGKDAKCVEAYCSWDDTQAHRARVNGLMDDVAGRLMKRGLDHDLSKLSEPEKGYFDEMTPKLKGSKFPSPEYDGFLVQMEEGLSLHYKKNRHHPQHFEAGADSMNLIDLIEMLADWKAAGERHADGGNLFRSIAYNAFRFGMSGWLKDALFHTAEDLGWWDGVIPSGICCDCGYDGKEETPCPARTDEIHCENWWDGPDVCEKCGDPFTADQDFIVCPKCQEEKDGED